jgi:hypothetical protein
MVDSFIREKLWKRENIGHLVLLGGIRPYHLQHETLCINGFMTGKRAITVLLDIPRRLASIRAEAKRRESLLQAI